MEARTEDGSISPTLVNLTNRPSVDVHQIPFNVTDPETTVFGPFWRIARVLGLVEGRTNGIDISSNGHKTLASRIIPTVLIIASAAPILARTIWLGSKMGQYKLWSSDWAYCMLLFTFSLHSIVCFIMLKVFGRRQFFNRFFRKIGEASENKIYQREKKSWQSLVVLCIVAVFFVYAMIWFNVENAIVSRELSENNTVLPDYRKSMFGDPLWMLMPLDTLITVWSAIISSVVLGLLFLLNNAMCKQYTHFHDQIREYSLDFQAENSGKKINGSSLTRKNGRASATQLSTSSSTQQNSQPNLADAQLLSRFDDRLMDFIALIKHVNESTEPLITVSFMSAFFSYVVSVFAVRAFKSTFQTLQFVTFYNWTALSVAFVFITLLPLAKLHSKMRETKNLILLEKVIWSEYDQQIHTIATNMVRRIDLVDYESRLFSAIRVTSAFFNLVMLFVPFFVDYVVTPQ
ncbi:CRE-SRR-1 protein [Ditylenchus destructor]|uniref:CRE-SRR-1 protein n=1 Tax=Ditylenchus destructor TaxID=166010 RepID=A0AAD4MYV9_9BILA|nr:CRE-SRR-1 protein [Ditylenchus destructor]